MSVTQTIPAINVEPKMRSFAIPELLIGLAMGLAGGVVQSVALGTALTHGLVVGGLFGLVFAILFENRSRTAGAGLIWGLASAFLMWLVFPAGLGPLYSRGFHSMGSLGDARNQFPLLVGYLVCLGMAVGLALGIRNGMRTAS